MATINKVDYNKSISNKKQTTDLSTIYDQETLDSLSIYNVLAKENDFIVYLNEQIDEAKNKNEEEILNILFELSETFKKTIKEVIKTLVSNTEKIAFMKFAESKVSRELTALHSYCMNKIEEKKNIELQRYCDYLIDNSNINYNNFQIHEENITYYKNYISILNKNDKDSLKTAEYNIYKSAITGSIENKDYAFAKSILKMKKISKLFSENEITVCENLIKKIYEEALINKLESSFVISTSKTLDQNISEINASMANGLIDKETADSLIEKIKDNNTFKEFYFRKEISNSVISTIYQLLNDIYSSKTYDINYRDINLDEGSKRFIRTVIENSLITTTDKIKEKRFKLFDSLSNKITSGFIDDIYAVIKSEDVLTYFQISDALKIIKIFVDAENERTTVTKE